MVSINNFKLIEGHLSPGGPCYQLERTALVSYSLGEALWADHLTLEHEHNGTYGWMDLWSTGKHFYQYSRSYYDIPRPFDSHFDWKKELMSGALKWAWTGASAHSAPYDMSCP